MKFSSPAWFFIGATLGSAVGVGVTYIVLKDKFEQQLNEEVAALKAHYVDRDKQLAKKNEQIKEELEEAIFSKTDVNEFMDYATMYKESASSETPEEPVISYNEVIDTQDDISAHAEIISDVDFCDPNFDTFRKISVDYFEDGAVYESLSGEELDGFDLIAGDDWKRAFGEFTPNVVYVRNHELMTDYEIIEQEGPHPHPEDE